MNRMVRTLAGALIVCVMACAPTIARAQTPEATPLTHRESRYEDVACPRKLPTGLIEGSNAICGVVTAPMYPYGGRDADATVRLQVVRIKAKSDHPKAEPLVILTGGPGQSMDAVLPLFGKDVPLYDPLRTNQDVILFDQRGMGLSTPSLACPFERATLTGSPTPVASPATSPEAAPAMASGIQPLIDCKRALEDEGIDQTAFTTRNNAADINAIAAAMGYAKVDLYGVSYGTNLALTAMRDFPDLIGQAVLSSTLPLDVEPLGGQIIGFSDALQKVFAGCAADPICDAHAPDLEQTLADLLTRLQKEPIDVTVKDPASGQSITLPVTDQDFMQFLYLSVFVGPLIQYAPQLIQVTADGNPAVLEQYAPLFFTLGGTSQGALFTYFCQDEFPFTSPDGIQQEATAANVIDAVTPEHFTSVAVQMVAICPQWNLPPSDPVQNTPVQSDIPTLIFAGAYDPITPPEFAEDAHENLSDSQIVAVVHGGHDPVGTMCEIGILTAFLDDPDASLDTECTAAPVDFSPGPGEASPEATPAASPIG